MTCRHSAVAGAGGVLAERFEVGGESGVVVDHRGDLSRGEQLFGGLLRFRLVYDDRVTDRLCVRFSCETSISVRCTYYRKGEAMTDRTFFNYHIDTIYDDDGETVIGYDVRQPGTTVDDPPIAEMLRTLAECREFIRAEEQFRRLLNSPIGGI